MNEQKPTNFLINPRTNWKFVLIVLILAFFVGGILGYQWLWQKKLEIQTPEIKITEKFAGEQPAVKQPVMEQKVRVITDKTEYERDDIIKYTIINNSHVAIFPILYKGKRVIKLEQYNYDTKKWEIPKYYTLINEWLIGYDGILPVFSVSSTNPVGPIPVLGKEENYLPLNKILNQFNDKVETYRLVFLYYESNECYENSFWGNPECGTARSRSLLNENWEEIRIATSNEFTVKGTTSAIVATVRPFCFEKFKENNFYLESAQFLNFDIDEDKEIIGLCWTKETDKKGLLIILDKQNNQYKPVLEKEGEKHQRHYIFENLKINDIDEDGIDEIIYKETGWYIAGGNSYLHLYSPKYQEWFYRDKWWRLSLDETNGIREIRKEGIKLSPNLDLEKYKVFKEFLLKQ